MSGARLVSLRPAALTDAQLLLTWRNDPETRRASFNTGEVTPGEHQRWLVECLRDPACKLWIATVNGRPIGQVRVDRRIGGTAEVSISIAPDERRRGYAKAALTAAKAEVATQAFAVKLIARIKPDNPCSLAAFVGAGFEKEGRDADAVVLVATPSPR